MSTNVFLGLGSNLGDREAHLRFAVDAIGDLPSTEVIATTEAKETAPIGPPQGPYLNQMVLIDTDHEPGTLLKFVQQIEKKAKRVVTERWGPRTLDIDLCLFGDRTVENADLIIPHREIGNRAFWLSELAELFPRTWSRADMGFPAWAQVSARRLAHIDGVAGLLAAWAVVMKPTARERKRWIRAAYLHDALKDAPDDLLTRLSKGRWGQLPLYHGPAAAHLAYTEGEADPGVLDAICYHTTGYAGWDEVGRILYVADFLEPGRTNGGTDTDVLLTMVPVDPSGALREVAMKRRHHALTMGHVVPDETRAFWATLQIKGD